MQILRVLKDYNCHNTLLLPPRAPGEKLPPEVLEYYQDQKRLQDEQGKPKPEEPAGQDNGEALALAALSVGTAGGPAHVFMYSLFMYSFSMEAGFSLPSSICARWRDSGVKVWFVTCIRYQP